MLFRVGGEEFLVFLNKQSLAKPRQMAQSLQQTFSQIHVLKLLASA